MLLATEHGFGQRRGQMPEHFDRRWLVHQCFSGLFQVFQFVACTGKLLIQLQFLALSVVQTGRLIFDDLLCLLHQILKLSAAFRLHKSLLRKTAHLLVEFENVTFDSGGLLPGRVHIDNFHRQFRRGGRWDGSVRCKLLRHDGHGAVDLLHGLVSVADCDFVDGEGSRHQVIASRSLVDGRHHHIPRPHTDHHHQDDEDADDVRDDVQKGIQRRRFVRSVTFFAHGWLVDAEFSRTSIPLPRRSRCKSPNRRCAPGMTSTSNVGFQYIRGPAMPHCSIRCDTTETNGSIASAVEPVSSTSSACWSVSRSGKSTSRSSMHNTAIGRVTPVAVAVACGSAQLAPRRWLPSPIPGAEPTWTAPDCGPPGPPPTPLDC